MYYESELYHYGRLGQKWGVRHGPPYPLDENGYSMRYNNRSIGEEYAYRHANVNVARIIGTTGAVAIAMTWTRAFIKGRI